MKVLEIHHGNAQKATWTRNIRVGTLLRVTWTRKIRVLEALREEYGRLLWVPKGGDPTKSKKLSFL